MYQVHCICVYILVYVYNLDYWRFFAEEEPRFRWRVWLPGFCLCCAAVDEEDAASVAVAVAAEEDCASALCDEGSRARGDGRFGGDGGSITGGSGDGGGTGR